MRQLALAAFALVAAGCVTHIAPYQAKRREFEAGDYQNGTAAKSGSVFARGRGLIEDDRASRVGDVLVIQVDETDSATHDATTKSGSTNNTNLGITGALAAAVSKVSPAVDLTNLFGSNSKFDFQGGGQIERKGTLSAWLPVRVRRVLPNDDLYVEGTKVVMVGHEEHHLYISGIVRKVDVRADGSVPSSRVADAEIEYTGRGDLTDVNRPGWGSRILTKIWPF
jgi:flagellar L-ring protein precursor FlgH